MDAHDRDYYQALQQILKVLINSFYGYPGTELHHFADPPLAAEVTRRGRIGVNLRSSHVVLYGY